MNDHTVKSFGEQLEALSALVAQMGGLADLWFITRLMRTAPVSREMVLNFVATRSLGLPPSY